MMARSKHIIQWYMVYNSMNTYFTTVYPLTPAT